MIGLLTPTLAADDLISHVAPHPVFEVFGHPVTNLQLMAFVAAALVLFVFAHVATRARARGEGVEAYVTKGRLAQLFETICGFVREEVARPNLGHLTDRYIYYIWSVFFFILFANLLGMVPIGQVSGGVVALFGGDAKAFSHLGGTATSTLSLNAVLAGCSLIAIVFIGLRENGVNFLKHFNPGPAYMAPLLVPLEVMGLLIKCCVLALRLFGTMLAGHLVIAALIGLIFTAGQVSAALGYGVGVAVVLGALALALLELFIALLQAFIFTFLTVLFIAAGAVHHDDEHEHEHEHAGDQTTHGHEALTAAAAAAAPDAMTGSTEQDQPTT